MLNHGTDPVEGYVNAGDILVTYESPAAGYLSYVPAARTKKYPASKFYHIVYSAADAAAMSQIVAHAKTINVGYIYVTNDSGANPYDTLPPYWATELGNLGCS